MQCWEGGHDANTAYTVGNYLWLPTAADERFMCPERRDGG